MSTQLELAARLAWQRWGHRFALFCRCTGCDRLAHCRGWSRKRMVCLDCFDEGRR